jgi:hypothetical protein
MDVLALGIQIESISWWEYCETLSTRPKYGLGGPASWYFPGWFPEVAVQFDDVPLGVDTATQQQIVLDLVERKAIGAGQDQLSFSKTEALTPGFWLAVPDYWEYRKPPISLAEVRVKEFKRGKKFIVKRTFESMNETVDTGTIMKYVGGGYSRYDDSLIYEFKEFRTKKKLVWIVQEVYDVDLWKQFFEEVW